MTHECYELDVDSLVRIKTNHYNKVFSSNKILNIASGFETENCEIKLNDQVLSNVQCEVDHESIIINNLFTNSSTASYVLEVCNILTPHPKTEISVEIYSKEIVERNLYLTGTLLPQNVSELSLVAVDENFESNEAGANFVYQVTVQSDHTFYLNSHYFINIQMPEDFIGSSSTAEIQIESQSGQTLHPLSAVSHSNSLFQIPFKDIDFNLKSGIVIKMTGFSNPAQSKEYSGINISMIDDDNLQISQELTLPNMDIQTNSLKHLDIQQIDSHLGALTDLLIQFEVPIFGSHQNQFDVHIDLSEYSEIYPNQITHILLDDTNFTNYELDSDNKKIILQNVSLTPGNQFNVKISKIQNPLHCTSPQISVFVMDGGSMVFSLSKDVFLNCPEVFVENVEVMIDEDLKISLEFSMRYEGMLPDDYYLVLDLPDLFGIEDRSYCLNDETLNRANHLCLVSDVASMKHLKINTPSKTMRAAVQLFLKSKEI